MLAKIITASGVIAALYFAFQHAWSGTVVSGIVAILAARWAKQPAFYVSGEGSH